MSINTTLSSVNSSSSTSQITKSSSSESSKKTSETSFKDEMNKVNEPEKETKKEEVSNKETKTTEKTEVKEEKVTENKETTTEKVEKTDKTNQKQEITEDKKVVTDPKEQIDKNKNQNIKDNVHLSKEAELKNLEMLKNQQLLDRNNILAFDKKQQQTELLENQQLLQQQNILAEKELNMQNMIDKNKTQDIFAQKIKNPNKKEEEKDITNNIDDLQNLTMIQQEIPIIENNYNVDTHKTEETELLSGNIIFNNTLSNFDANNNELLNDIQQMMNTSAVKTGAAAGIEAAQSIGTMSLNSANKVSMTQSDAEFFVNLAQNADDSITVQNITAQATEMTQKGADVKEVEKNVKVSQALLDALSESRETNKPLRIDFDQNVSVVLRVNKEGTIAANFIPHDKAVEQYLRNNIETLKNTFNENDIPYSDLNYSNRGSKQQKEQQRNRQQQQ